MRIILWGARAVEFDAESVRAMGAKEPVIAIFVGTLPKIAHGEHFPTNLFTLPIYSWIVFFTVTRSLSC